MLPLDRKSKAIDGMYNNHAWLTQELYWYEMGLLLVSIIITFVCVCAFVDYVTRPFPIILLTIIHIIKITFSIKSKIIGYNHHITQFWWFRFLSQINARTHTGIAMQKLGWTSKTNNISKWIGEEQIYEKWYVDHCVAWIKKSTAGMCRQSFNYESFV